MEIGVGVSAGAGSIFAGLESLFVGSGSGVIGKVVVLSFVVSSRETSLALIARQKNPRPQKAVKKTNAVR